MKSSALRCLSFATLSACLAFSASASTQLNEAAQWWQGHPSLIKLCFASKAQIDWTESFNSTGDLKELDENQKSRLDQIIRSQFSEAKTGVSFKIMGTCQDLNPTEVDAVLFYASSNHSAYAGTSGFTGFPSAANRDKKLPYLKVIAFQPNPFYVATHAVVQFPLPLPDQIDLTFLHELGHLAGLAHEQDRSEALLDLNCRLLPKAHQRRGADYGRSQLPTGSTALGPYDPTSIMNYCYEAMIKTKNQASLIELSPGDQAALKSLHP